MLRAVHGVAKSQTRLSILGPQILQIMVGDVGLQRPCLSEKLVEADRVDFPFGAGELDLADGVRHGQTVHRVDVGIVAEDDDRLGTEVGDEA